MTPPIGTIRDPKTGSWGLVFVSTGRRRFPAESWTHRQAVLAMRQEQGRTE